MGRNLRWGSIEGGSWGTRDYGVWNSKSYKQEGLGLVAHPSGELRLGCS